MMSLRGARLSDHHTVTTHEGAFIVQICLVSKSVEGVRSAIPAFKTYREFERPSLIANQIRRSSLQTP
jgi:hypothetical protein